MEKELDVRIKVLEDIEEIKKLKARYLYYIDDREWDRWGKGDGTLSLFGACAGRC